MINDNRDQRATNANFFQYLEKGITAEIMPVLKKKIINKVIEDVKNDLEILLDRELADHMIDMYGGVHPLNRVDELRVIINHAKKYVSEFQMQEKITISGEVGNGTSD